MLWRKPQDKRAWLPAFSPARGRRIGVALLLEPRHVRSAQSPGRGGAGSAGGLATRDLQGCGGEGGRVAGDRARGGCTTPPVSPPPRTYGSEPVGDGKGGSFALTERHRSILDPRFACLQATRDDRFNAPADGLSARCGPFWRRDPTATVPIDPATCRVCALGATQTGRIEACQPLPKFRSTAQSAQ